MKRLFIIAVGALILLAGWGGVAAGAIAPGGLGAADQQAPTAPPSAAFGPLSEANRIVQGAETPTDDLNDEGTLCNGCSYSHGNYTGLWQAILWSEGLLPTSGVDCDFGPNTASATWNFQDRYSLGRDGIVGPETRRKAGSFLFTSSGTAYNLYYLGTNGRVVYLFRDTTSPYNYWIWWGSQWRVVYYGTQSIPGC